MEEIGRDDTTETMEWIDATSMRVFDDGSLTHDATTPSTIAERIDVGSSIDVEEFTTKMASLGKMEARTAQAFLDRGIYNDFKWPAENETNQDAQLRKKLNSTTLKNLTKRRYRNPENT